MATVFERVLAGLLHPNGPWKGPPFDPAEGRQHGGES
jgi:hypothetical protein